MMYQKGMNKKRILIVDDERSVTQMLTVLLETRGYSISVAATAKEAFEKVTDTTDLILLDVILPDEDGFKVCQKLKEDKKTHHIPIIILSAKMLSEDIIEGLYLGADDYITKPFEYEELVARIEAVMRRGAFLENGKASVSDKAIIRELRKVVDEELITPFFQPIFLLRPFTVLGFEALSRPRSNTSLSNPEILFKAAIQFGFYQDLEILSWRKAIHYASEHIQEVKLFLNCNPYLVEGPAFLTVKSIFSDNHINVKNVVLEITERSSIIDYKVFFKKLEHYRGHGFQFAVDDVGGGYASLETIVETKPEIVKIDRHIVHNLDGDRFKKSIIKFIVAFCKENGILSIAEGIETKKDLEVVMELGVDAAQGFYLYKPAPYIDIDEVCKVGQ